MKMLIVDDKEENLDLLEVILKGSGCEVVLARDGVEALEKLKKGPIDMIISDVLMPKMDGFQLCRECERDDELRKIPFLFLTASYVDKSDEEFGLSLGAERFMVKPIEPDVFMKIMKEVIEQHRKGRLIASKKPIEGEAAYLSGHRDRLIRKLEEKMLDLENANKALQSRTYDLNERYKELNCLYGISNLVEKSDISLQEILEGTVELIPSSWQYPEITCARIIMEGREFTTKNFKETAWNLTSNVAAGGRNAGAVEVFYLEEKPESDEGPFLKEERNLINAIAERLGRIIEHKKIEEKLKEYQGHLEELVDERTSELQEEVSQRKKAEGLIREQNERLKELDRMKSEFLSTAAHELRTPLTSILGFSEILLKRKLDEERRNKFLKIINEESLGLSALINDLLDLSRIESGRGFKISKAPIEIKEVILENIDIFQAQTDKHTFKTNLSHDLVKIEADKDKINQVMENLISNALKFSPEGGEITVSIEQSKDKIKVSVSDNGMGIPEKDLPHLFEKFYRAENASSKAIGGTGLGLAIVKYIVESHGGRISAESKIRKGSTFSFALPIKSTRARTGRKE